MKPSGIPWLGDVPEEWEIVPLYKTVCQVKSPNEGMVEKNLLSLSYGRIIRKDMETAFGLVPESYASYNRIEPNDIVLRLTDLQNDQKSLRVGFSQERGIVTSAYLTLRPEGNCFAEYIAYAIKLFDFKKGFYGIGSGVRQSLKFSEVKRFQVPFPPLPEQQAIAERIDCEVARVDALREKIKREIECLGDYKKSLIAETVTRGLRKRKMKPSGIPWLGDVPAEWEITRLGNLYRAVTDENSDGKRTNAMKFFYGEIVPKTNFDAEEDLYVAKTIRTYTIVQPKDIVVNGLNLNFDLISMRIAQAEEDGVITSAYIVMRPIAEKRAFPDYVKYLLKAFDFRKAFHNMGQGVRKSLSFSELGKLKILLPTLPAQREIAEYLDRAVSKIDAVIARRKSQLEKLEAFKRSLIQEYVTGKREMRQ